MLDKAKVPAMAVGAALLGAAGMAAARSGGNGRSGLLPGGRGSKLRLPKPKSGVAKAIGKAGRSLPSLPKPDLKEGLKGMGLPQPDGPIVEWVEETAKGVGDAGYRVADMASQARRVQKALGDD
jgi:hypothetical protein